MGNCSPRTGQFSSREPGKLVTRQAARQFQEVWTGLRQDFAAAQPIFPGGTPPLTSPRPKPNFAPCFRRDEDAPVRLHR
jgi:hypothetical protein